MFPAYILKPWREKMLTKLVVFGDLGGFTDRQLLTDRTQIASYVRASMNEGRFSGDIVCTDEELLEKIDHAVTLGEGLSEELTSEDDIVVLCQFLEASFPDPKPEQKTGEEASAQA